MSNPHPPKRLAEIRRDYEALGGSFIESAEPKELFAGAWLTGPVPRLYPEQNWTPDGLRFINADLLARQLGLAPYVAADVAGRLRAEMVARGESFASETVLSDPVGEKVEFLRRTAAGGYTVVLCFIGPAGVVQSVD